MSSIVLRVYVVETDATKVIKYDPRITVQDALAITQEKANVPVGIYGLFLKAEDGTGKWLKEEKTLLFYDLKSNDVVEFRKKQRPLRIKMLDETIKTVIVDESQPVVDVVRQIAKKIGLGNADEYSLIEEKKDADWLKPTTSLHEQGISSDAVLLMKKKFFFSDANIDASDPLELHLLYVQATKQILSEELRCSMEEAIKLAALQLQASYGNHNPNKHKVGMIKLEEILPMTFRKARGIDKEIFQEHRKLTGVSDVHAKHRYVGTCRQIKTYGITFFNIKEKTKKDKKIMNRLLGITRDSILRVDAETKSVISHYPLTHLRRWAANPGSFTMDFGDYEDEYVVVQTTDGDAISQLIAGYIDIILQKRREGNVVSRHMQEEEMVATEEVVGAVRAQAITTMSGALSSQQQATASGSSAAGMQGLTAQMAGVGIVSTEASLAQCATILSEIDMIYQDISVKSATLSEYDSTESMMQAAMATVTAAVAETHGKAVEIPAAKIVEPEDAPLELARVGETLAAETAVLVSTRDASQAILSSRSILTSCASIMSAAKAACAIQGSRDAASNHKMLEAVQLMATATAQLATAQRRNDQVARVAAARQIASATSMLISAGELKHASLSSGAQGFGYGSNAMSGYAQVGSGSASGAAVAGSVSAGSMAVSGYAGGSAGMAIVKPAAKHSQAVMGAAKGVAECCARLMATSKTTAQTADPVLAEKVVLAAKAAAAAVQELSSQAKIAADRVTLAMADANVEAGLVAAAKALGSSIAILVGATHAAAASGASAAPGQPGRIDPAQQQLIAFSAKAVADSIAGFVGTAKTAMASIPTHIVREELQTALRDIDDASDGLMTAIVGQSSDTGTLASVNSVVSASARLVSAARSAALRTQDEGKRAELHRAAERANNLVAAVITSGQDAQSLQENEQVQGQVKAAVQELTGLATILLEAQLKDDLVDASAKFATTVAGLQSFAQEASVFVSPVVQQGFALQLKAANDAIATLHSARSKVTTQGQDTTTLVETSRNASVAIAGFIDSARAIMTTCNNPAIAQKLAGMIAAANEATSKLVSAYRAAGSDQKDIDQMILQTDAVTASMTQLLNSVEADESTLMEAAKKVALSANEMVVLVNDKVSSITNPELAEHLTLAAKSIASATSQLVPAAKSVLKNKSDHDSRIKLSSAASAVCSSVKNLVSAAQSTFSFATPSRSVLTSHNAVIAAAELSSTVPLAKVEEELVPEDSPMAAALAEGAALLAAGYTDEAPVGGRGHSASVSKTLACATTSVANATGSLASATSRVLLSLNESPDKMGDAVQELSSSTTRVVQAATSQIDKIKSEALRNQLKLAAKAVSKATSNLVTTAKSKTNTNLSKQQMAAACKDVATFTQNVMTTTKIASAIAPLEESLQSIVSPCPPWKVKITETSMEFLSAIDKVTQATVQADLLTSAKALAQKSSALTTAAKEGAGATQESVLQQQLLDAAKALTDGTAQLISAARARLANPDAAGNVERAGRALKNATTSVVQAAEFASVNSHGDTIVAAAKPVVAHIVDLVAKISNKDDLMPVVKSLNVVTNKFAAALRTLAALTPDEYTQGELFDVAQDLSDAASEAVMASRSGANEQEVFQRMMASANNLVTLTQKSINCGRTASTLCPKVDSTTDNVELEVFNSSKALESLATRIIALKAFADAGVVRRIYEVADPLLEGTRNIFAACTRLVTIARAVQRDLFALRTSNPQNAVYQANAELDEVFVTALKNVVATFSQLVDTTNEYAQGYGKESRVIQAAQGVATATTQFVASSRQGGRDSSRNYDRLQAAARQITQSTGLLVRTAQQAIEQSGSGSFRGSEYLTTSFADAQKRDIETKKRLLKLERQLAAARDSSS
eukprot:TRINITY_DN1586_c0_g2_i1.p1 TRINITY_DN1586_c0_g2~~TRINITY_DN1586_c0_g2_i1.p1  ORF type:complete len:1874 (-),score=553.08 TRINITY_DN1586_c0_g2_i1:211-5832(-)